MAIILDCGFKIVPHPPYLPDLAPSDFHLFPNMKKALAGQCFANNDEVMDAVEGFLGNQEKEFFLSRINALQHH